MWFSSSESKKKFPWKLKRHRNFQLKLKENSENFAVNVWIKKLTEAKNIEPDTKNCEVISDWSE